MDIFRSLSATLLALCRGTLQGGLPKPLKRKLKNFQKPN